jgi:acyl-CoA synthetase (AMP-forming)/AMP-acid ligase II
LITLGIAPRSRIAVLDTNHSRYFEIYYGALKTNCAFVGLNSRLAAPEIAWIVNDAEARVLFVGAGHYSLVEQIEAEMPSIAQIVALDGGHSRWPSYGEWRDSLSSRDPEVPGEFDDDVIQLYTSGTTGHPKGVCHTNRTWHHVADAARAADWGAYDASTVMLVCVPVFHVAGFNLTNMTLLAGGTVVLTRQVDPPELLEVLARHRVTDTLFVPAIILALVSLPNARSANLASLATILYGAAPIAESLLDQARATFGCEFVHLYGLTENLGMGTHLAADMHDPKLGKLRSVGRPYPGLELTILDADGKPQGSGEIGEIVMKSPWVMRAYWRNPQATDSTVRDGWLHSGDAGYRDADGYVYIVDRVKDMIVSGGENVYPAEVENALFDHPAVQDVAVIGVPDERWGESVKAIVVVRPGMTLDGSDLIRHARERIAGYKVPKTVEVVPELPRNASGKVLRRELREKYWAGRDRRVN